MVTLRRVAHAPGELSCAGAQTRGWGSARGDWRHGAPVDPRSASPSDASCSKYGVSSAALNRNVQCRLSAAVAVFATSGTGLGGGVSKDGSWPPTDAILPGTAATQA